MTEDDCRAACARVSRYGAGFFEVHTPQSMTRLVALVCAIAALVLARAAAGVALRPHLTAEHADVIRALATMATGYVAGGAVALLVRSRPKANTSPTAPPALPKPPAGSGQ